MKYLNKIEKKHKKPNKNHSKQIILNGWKCTVCFYSIGFSSFFSILFLIFCHLSFTYYRILLLIAFLPFKLFLNHWYYIYANFILYLRLKMTSERLKHRVFLSLIFITKYIKEISHQV